MIDDYIKTLRAELTQRLGNETAKLLHTAGNERHDLVRGRVLALQEAIEVVERTAANISAEVE